MSIAIYVNGKATTVGTAARSLLGLINNLGLEPSRVALELNGDVIEPQRWAETLLQMGDKVELVQFVGGG